MDARKDRQVIHLLGKTQSCMLPAYLDTKSKEEVAELLFHEMKQSILRQDYITLSFIRRCHKTANITLHLDILDDIMRRRDHRLLDRLWPFVLTSRQLSQLTVHLGGVNPNYFMWQDLLQHVLEPIDKEDWRCMAAVLHAFFDLPSQHHIEMQYLIIAMFDRFPNLPAHVNLMRASQYLRTASMVLFSYLVSVFFRHLAPETAFSFFRAEKNLARAHCWFAAIRDSPIHLEFGGNDRGSSFWSNVAETCIERGWISLLDDLVSYGLYEINMTSIACCLRSRSVRVYEYCLTHIVDVESTSTFDASQLLIDIISVPSATFQSEIMHATCRILSFLRSESRHVDSPLEDAPTTQITQSKLHQWQASFRKHDNAFYAAVLEKPEVATDLPQSLNQHLLLHRLQWSHVMGLQDEAVVEVFTQEPYIEIPVECLVLSHDKRRLYHLPSLVDYIRYQQFLRQDTEAQQAPLLDPTDRSPWPSSYVEDILERERQLLAIYELFEADEGSIEIEPSQTMADAANDQ